mmetsp:Transcript_30378/g.64627  ORF Transcript_30378/g.64627 Transcript_30378/m.64627 type:complete len:95 (-) Transcript_30378:18-302(-)
MSNQTSLSLLRFVLVCAFFEERAAFPPRKEVRDEPPPSGVCAAPDLAAAPAAAPAGVSSSSKMGACTGSEEEVNVVDARFDENGEEEFVEGPET